MRLCSLAVLGLGLAAQLVDARQIPNPMPSRYPGDTDDGDMDDDEVLALLILVVAIVGTLIGIGVLFMVFMLCAQLVRRVRWSVFGIDEDGISDRQREQLLPDEDSRQSYELARAFERQYPYGSVNTQLTTEQETQIREKGVNAWEFVVSLDVNAMLQTKTDVLFMGGDNCVQTNLPIPKTNSVYYFEVKIVEKPADVNMWIGLATKPYPAWRMTGWNKYSVGYSVNNGNLHQNSPFKGQHIGEQLYVGDILGIGYQPRSGIVWFTRNGRRYKAIATGMLYDVFPTISADGPCSFSANIGQRGYVFIEANVKRWGFAPIEGVMQPPPVYGANQNTILLEAAEESEESDGSVSDADSDGTGSEEQAEVSSQAQEELIDMENAVESHATGSTSRGEVGGTRIPAAAAASGSQGGEESPHRRNGRRRRHSRYQPPQYQEEDPIAAQLLEAGTTYLEPVAEYRNKQQSEIGESSRSGSESGDSQVQAQAQPKVSGDADSASLDTTPSA
ncbi:Protein ssh4 [Linderina macrospora]|uniref:Protein ssh4 n=1 Tax=Linderina macrospora TaxID=4868 RepID=A0ACC1JHV1_9FUNG|nr:Protein ssh4 [Linderina macrospora]